MVSCASCGCTMTQKTKNEGITFHSFPKDCRRRTLWIEFLRKPDWLPKPSSVLCSYHFAQDCFDRTSKLKVRLLATAVPTVEVERLKYCLVDICDRHLRRIAKELVVDQSAKNTDVVADGETICSSYSFKNTVIQNSPVQKCDLPDSSKPNIPENKNAEILNTNFDDIDLGLTNSNNLNFLAENNSSLNISSSDLDQSSENLEHLKFPLNDTIQNKTLRQKIVDWALQNNINQKALSELLTILNQELPNGHQIPNDARALLKTLEAL
ncbi:unnamed protein product [Diabrotica balteata]|uniref:THAP-type domain-containing protein n=1 Tax=Diabrotica balteata TaxID=107213 RepID=A0A9N9XGJ2_DIABA|nr:unnamed protein product [Diabrotica balteata]